tara:strand:+ start:57 stop:1115 length:1059 start_codon:yes stop_codon:yes gene_type:complete
MNKINITIDQNPIEYIVQLGENILLNTFDLIYSDSKCSYVIIYDQKVDSLIVDGIIDSFPNTNKPYLLAIDLSSNKKSFDMYNYIISKLLEYNCDKSTILIAVGGGSIGDVVGFVASTFYRGIDYIQVPSTLLAMIDSSIGGKTAIDTTNGKNLIGSFYHPKMVIIDPLILKSINEAEINSALFEAIKYGLAIDYNLFKYIKDNINEFKNMVSLLPLIKRCCKIKAEIVEKDERDDNQRQKLNFGHTIGHAIEIIYNLRHGEAVGYGMIAACYMSKVKGTLVDSSYEESIKLIKNLTLPNVNLDKDLIISQINRDKKRVSGKNNFILLNEIGSSYISNDISNDIINESILIL